MSLQLFKTIPANYVLEMSACIVSQLQLKYVSEEKSYTSGWMEIGI